MIEWGQDDLSKFLDMVHANQKANRVNFAPVYHVILKIDGCLGRAGKNLVNVKPVMTGILLLRCLYAFRTAAGMALAGQVVEAFPIMRSALEYTGYALLIFADPNLEVVFIDRHQGDAEMKLQREEFSIGEVRRVLARFDAKLAENFDLLYQRTIDFGGHPNPHGTFSAMQMDKREGETGITAFALTADRKAIAHALKSVAQVGLTTLYIFQHIFETRFELLGIKADIEWLRTHAPL